jgi:hypothetical protein
MGRESASLVRDRSRGENHLRIGTVPLALLAATTVSLWQAVRATHAENVARRRSYYAQMGVVMRDLKEGRGGRFQELMSQPRATPVGFRLPDAHRTEAELR